MTQDKEFRDLWAELGNVPVNNDGELEEVFSTSQLGIYLIGTDREEIWHDIEDHFNISIGDTLTLRRRRNDL